MFHPDELRDHNGKWSKGGLAAHDIHVDRMGTVRWRGQVAGKVVRRAGGHEAVSSRTRERVAGPKLHATESAAAAHVAIAHMKAGPPTKPWKDPPAPGGTRGRKAGGYTAVGITNTELGDAVEHAIVQHMGTFEDAHPGKRQGRFDLLWDGHAYEVKAVSQSASEYKAKPKAHEVTEKLDYAKENGLQPHVMIVVYAPPTTSGPGQLYVYSKPGVGAYRLTQPTAGWVFHGTVPLNIGKTWDPAANPDTLLVAA